MDFRIYPIRKSFPVDREVFSELELILKMANRQMANRQIQPFWYFPKVVILVMAIHQVVGEELNHVEEAEDHPVSQPSEKLVSNIPWRCMDK